MTINRSYLSPLPGELCLLHKQLLTQPRLPFSRASKSVLQRPGLLAPQGPTPTLGSPAKPGGWTGKQLEMPTQKLYLCLLFFSYAHLITKVILPISTPVKGWTRVHYTMSAGVFLKGMWTYLHMDANQEQGVAATVKTVSVSIIKLISSNLKRSQKTSTPRKEPAHPCSHHPTYQQNYTFYEATFPCGAFTMIFN